MKLTIIGGGGVRTPRLIPSLVRRAKRLDLQEVWLLDTDKARLELMGGMCRELARQLDAPFQVVLSADAKEALRGASHIISAIRPGFERQRALDERIAFKHGALGQETTGAGGFAMAMRSLPAILEYCQLAEEVAPGAWIYNFTNPAGLVAQGLQAAGVKRVIGICDSANGAQHAASRYMGIPLAQIRHQVFGLNHLSWTRSVKVRVNPDGTGGEEVLPGLLADPKFIKSTHMVMFDRDLVASLGMFFNEYLHYFYHRREALTALLAKHETRGEEVVRLTGELFERLQAENSPEAQLKAYHEVMNRRSDSYMAHARQDEKRPRSVTVEEHEEGYAGVALGCVEAIATGQPHFTGLNVPNRSAISGMAEDDVVEVSCVIDANGPHPVTTGEIPEGPYLLMREVKRYERLAVEAILKRSRRLATEALFAHPLVASYPLAKTLVAEYLEAQKDSLGQWN